jgi:curved DNA-binding protein CbpA
MKRYFQDCKTIAEAKKLYHKLCKEYHPDISPHPDATRIMQDINNQFDNFKVQDDADLKYKEEQEHFTQESEQFRNIITDLYRVKGIKFDVLGSWIWITKSTKDIKELIKAINPKGEKYEMYKPFLWHRKKGMWYCSPKSYRGGSSGKPYWELKLKYEGESHRTAAYNSDVVAV